MVFNADEKSINKEYPAVNVSVIQETSVQWQLRNTLRFFCTLCFC